MNKPIRQRVKEKISDSPQNINDRFPILASTLFLHIILTHYSGMLKSKGAVLLRRHVITAQRQ